MSQAIPVNSLSPEDIAGLEGNYIIAPECGFAIWFPKEMENGLPVLPDDWYDDCYLPCWQCVSQEYED